MFRQMRQKQIADQFIEQAIDELIIEGRKDCIQEHISSLQSSNHIIEDTHIVLLDNFETFCDKIKISSETLIKILGFILDCRSGINKTKQCYLQGNYTNEQLKNIVKNFAETYILCIHCGIPETTLQLTKENDVKKTCYSCGVVIHTKKCHPEIVNMINLGKLWSKYKKYMYNKWYNKYKKNLDHMFYVMNNCSNIEIEFEIFYTTNHIHHINYINDLLSYKNYLYL